MFAQAFSLHERNNDKKREGLSPPFVEKVEYSIGIVHGLFCGLLGISGGVVTTPMQQILIDVSIRKAIVISLLLSIPCTLIGSAVTVMNGVDQGTFSVDQIVLASLFPALGALLGTKIGTYFSEIVNRASLLIMFAIIYFVASFSILS